MLASHLFCSLSTLWDTDAATHVASHFGSCCILLSNWHRFALAGIQEAISIYHIKTHYFTSHQRLVRARVCIQILR